MSSFDFVNVPGFASSLRGIRGGDTHSAGNLVLAVPGNKLSLWLDISVFWPMTIVKAGEKGSPHHIPNMPRARLPVH